MGFFSDVFSDPAKAFTSDLTGGNSAIAKDPIGTAAEIGAIAMTGGAAAGAIDLGGMAAGAGGLLSSGAAGAADLFSGITASGITSALGIAGGINSLTGGGITKALGLGGSSTSGPSTAPGSTTATANPMAPYQQQLAAQYAGYLTQGNQTDITKMPGYSQYQSGVVQPAMNQAQATAAASGQLYSGGEQMALQNIGQQGYSAFMNNYMAQLSAGATGGAYQGAQLGTSQQNLSNTATSQGLGAIGTGLAGLFGGGSGTQYESITPVGQYGTNTYGNSSSTPASMPSNNAANIDPNAGWSI